MCCICVLIGDFPGIDIVLPRTGSLGARGVGPGGVGTAAPTLSNTRAYPQSPYGYMYVIYIDRKSETGDRYETSCTCKM